MTYKTLTWIPRKRNSPYGYVTAPGRQIVARDIRQDDARAMFPGASISYDSAGMDRIDEHGVTFAETLAKEVEGA